MSSAMNVVTLKNSVPSDWVVAVHHAALAAARARQQSEVWSAPPIVNRIEPTKNVIASASAPTSCA